MTSRTMSYLTLLFMIIAGGTLAVTYSISRDAEGSAVSSIPTATPTAAAVAVNPTATPSATPATPVASATPVVQATATPALTGDTTVDQNLKSLDATMSSDTLTNLQSDTLSDTAINAQ